MKTLKMIRLGSPILRIKSTKVTLKELKTKRFQKFLDRLIEAAFQGVGIAAPQVGVNKRVIVVTVDPKKLKSYTNKKPFPTTVIINPKIISRSQEIKEDWEGDLSADLRGLVPRSISCMVVGLDRNGREIKFDLQDDFHARIFQHEMDHLDGIMFVDRVKKKKSLSEDKTWRKYWKGKDLKELPF